MSAQTEPHWTERGVTTPLESTPQTDHMFQQTTREFQDVNRGKAGGTKTHWGGWVEAAPMDWFHDGLMDLGGFKWVEEHHAWEELLNLVLTRWDVKCRVRISSENKK